MVKIKGEEVFIVKKNYRIKKTISMKQFVSKFGENFSEHMKKRLLELDVRTVLTREDYDNRFDVKHVEHTQYEVKDNSGKDSDVCKKEYVYGQFITVDGALYFSEECSDNPKSVESPVVDNIYKSLNSEDMISYEGNSAKKIDDSNIDYIIDTLLTACPQVSQSYLKIMSKYL